MVWNQRQTEPLRRPEFCGFQHDPFDSTTISDAYVTRLLEDSRGDIWTGSLSGVVNVFEWETGIFCTVPMVNETGEKVKTNEHDGTTLTIELPF